MVFYYFFQKIITCYRKLLSDGCDQFGYPGSIVYLSCCFSKLVCLSTALASDSSHVKFLFMLARVSDTLHMKHFSSIFFMLTTSCFTFKLFERGIYVEHRSGMYWYECKSRAKISCKTHDDTTTGVAA